MILLFLTPLLAFGAYVVTLIVHARRHPDHGHWGGVPADDRRSVPCPDCGATNGASCVGADNQVLHFGSTEVVHQGRKDLHEGEIMLGDLVILTYRDGGTAEVVVDRIEGSVAHVSDSAYVGAFPMSMLTVVERSRAR